MDSTYILDSDPGDGCGDLGTPPYRGDSGGSVKAATTATARSAAHAAAGTDGEEEVGTGVESGDVTATVITATVGTDGGGGGCGDVFVSGCDGDGGRRQRRSCCGGRAHFCVCVIRGAREVTGGGGADEERENGRRR